MIPTAVCRVHAREAEKRLEWSIAAQWWQKAISSYPEPHKATAKIDIDTMRRMLAACEGMEPQ